LSTSSRLYHLAARSCTRQRPSLILPGQSRPYHVTENSLEFEHTMAQRDDFISKYEDVIKPLLQKSDPGLAPVTARLREILQYNTVGGKLNRGCAVVHTAQLLGYSNTFHATVLGWCVEILQGFLLVADDIMDNSEMRRGQQCWYKSVGMTAINDSFLLESCVFELLKTHLGSEKCYVKCLELFLDVTRKTEFGQALDLEVESLDYSEYSMERYDSIVIYKTAYYSFYLPVALAMHLTGRDSELELESARKILIKIGHYFQVQDDYLDCYGDPSVIGKVGTDIQERKCSWLFLNAVKLATEEDKEELFRSYGKEDEESVSIVKLLYLKYGLRRKYLEYSATTYASICSDIDNNKSGLPVEIFQDFLDKIHKRSK